MAAFACTGAAIYHSASGRDGRADPFKRFKPFFIGMNAAVSAAVALLFLLMSQTEDLGRKASLSLAGVLVTSVTAICMSTGFLVYGAKFAVVRPALPVLAGIVAC